MIEIPVWLFIISIVYMTVISIVLGFSVLLLVGAYRVASGKRSNS